MKKMYLLMMIFLMSFSSCIQAGEVAVGSSRSAVSITYDFADEEIGLAVTEITGITLRGDAIIVDGCGAVADGSKVAITSAGIYVISGKLDDGQVIVKSEGQGEVYLILSGAEITCSSSAPIYVNKADSTVVILADGTKNIVTDGYSYLFADSTTDEPNAAVFSKDDLTIKGKGSLTVNANYNNGIQSKDDLDILGGHITVNAKNDAIKGRDSINIRGGSLSVKSGADGLQSTSNEDPGSGIIAISGGEIDITSGGDGIQAITQLLVSGGDIRINSGGGSANSNGNKADRNQRFGRATAVTANIDAVSSKGLKAGTDITITGGMINIDACDDAVHSDGAFTLEGGKMILSTGDDGIRSTSEAVINGGEVSIIKCYEGIESTTITMNEGRVQIVSNDDGINVGAGETGGGLMGGMPGLNMQGQRVPQWGSDNHTRGGMMDPGVGSRGYPMTVPQGPDMQGQGNSNADNNSYLYINGGYLVIDAAGDGLDVNGSIVMTGGTVIINGPTANDNGALDYYGTFRIDGGVLVAAGSAGMAQAPSTSSTQYSVIAYLASAQQADTIFHIESENGDSILTFAPAKTYQSVVFSSPGLEKGLTCDIYTGGTSSGPADDGMYNSGIYSGGNKVLSFTASSTVTSAGSARGGANSMPGGFAPGGGTRW